MLQSAKKFDKSEFIKGYKLFTKCKVWLGKKCSHFLIKWDAEKFLVKFANYRTLFKNCLIFEVLIKLCENSANLFKIIQIQ